MIPRLAPSPAVGDRAVYRRRRFRLVSATAAVVELVAFRRNAGVPVRIPTRRLRWQPHPGYWMVDL